MSERMDMDIVRGWIREVYIEYALELGSSWELQVNTHLDEYLASVNVKRKKLQNVTCACMFIASCTHGLVALDLPTLAAMTANAYTPVQLLGTLLKVMRVLMGCFSTNPEGPMYHKRSPVDLKFGIAPSCVVEMLIYRMIHRHVTCPYVAQLAGVRISLAGVELLVPMYSPVVWTVHIPTFAYQLQQGLAALHLLGIAHRDVKLDNLCLDLDGNLKIVDFNSAHTLLLRNTVPITTLTSRAPEIVMRNTPYDCVKLDTWAYGCVIAHLLLGRPLFDSEEIDKSTRIVFMIMGRLSKLSRVAPLARWLSVLRQCFDVDPDTRPTVAELVINLN
jgi:hypothetical protein